ncbi:MAG: hypothetical protein RMK64_00125 [Rhodovarius sp.]|nr:hypothetical protein [Rhodovarius sp.]MCX7932557.1 hypothetical protein [Rhodovarius sp.]MDW8313348.1 hypothetical protein [Rhodovarius sp.]
MSPRTRLRRAWRGIPVAVRFFLLHGLMGFGLSALLTGAILWADPGGLGRLLLSAEAHPLPLLLLWFFLGLSFGGVQTAAAVMLLGEPNSAPRPPRGAPAPVLAALRARRRLRADQRIA